jgi:hypothetical protein
MRTRGEMLLEFRGLRPMQQIAADLRTMSRQSAKPFHTNTFRSTFSCFTAAMLDRFFPIESSNA